MFINMKRHFLLALLSVACFAASAQVKFISSGRIEFEKRSNQFSYFDQEDEESPWIVEMKKTFPKMVTETYVMDFNEEKTVYKLVKEDPSGKYAWGRKPSENDVTVKDVKTGQISLQRDIFEQTYLIKDSLRNYKWRMTNETRTIAGFECRKAVTIISDSVYIVAFYTEEITVSSGPESFSGLPGMILGLAVPRLQMTWFATKVELKEPSAAVLTPKQKGKAATWATYEKDLNKAMSEWGKYGAKVLWNSML
jgi:GLPGLI family protein